ncbi:hypothetical protein K449DRAFT_427648 [Hypoxylon sp. EC38]|nr:hypothetical protein K449DRAFT_427648 [Hypoxylon sp. EC38]
MSVRPSHVLVSAAEVAPTPHPVGRRNPRKDPWVKGDFDIGKFMFQTGSAEGESKKAIGGFVMGALAGRIEIRPREPNTNCMQIRRRPGNGSWIRCWIGKKERKWDGGGTTYRYSTPSMRDVEWGGDLGSRKDLDW